VEPVREPTVALRVEVVEPGIEGDVVHEARQTETGRDRGIEVRKVEVVEVPDREHLAVARVVEQVSSPALLHVRDRLDAHELEAHRIAVEAMSRLEITGGDGDVVESHASSLAFLLVRRLTRRHVPKLPRGGRR